MEGGANMWIIPYPLEVAKQIREPEKVRLVDQWHMWQEVRAARGVESGSLRKTASGTFDRSVDLTKTVVTATRAWFAKPPKPQQQCC